MVVVVVVVRVAEVEVGWGRRVVRFPTHPWSPSQGLPIAESSRALTPYAYLELNQKKQPPPPPPFRGGGGGGGGTPSGNT